MQEVQTELKEDLCPHSSVPKGMTELRKCKGWGYCCRTGYAGDYRKCPTYKNLELDQEVNQGVHIGQKEEQT